MNTKPSKVIPIIKAEALIPAGMYCYESLGPIRINESGMPVMPVNGKCPFWSLNEAQIEADNGSTQRAGYCAYLKLGDWMEDGTFLLFDSVKECGVKDDQDYYEQYTNTSGPRHQA